MRQKGGDREWGARGVRTCSYGCGEQIDLVTRCPVAADGCGVVDIVRGSVVDKFTWFPRLRRTV